MTDIGELIHAKFDGLDPRIHIDIQGKVMKEISGELFITAIGNIVSNAQKFTPIDGHIEILVSSDGISIEDTGPGIRKEYLPYIFDRLWKADTSRTHGSGYGLGLSIARKIIEELHSMQIFVESEEGRGTKFLVRWR